MTHLTPQQLGARLDGALSGTALEAADRHLEGCAECREGLAQLASLDRSLATALTNDPDDAYFNSFASRVEDRLRSQGLSGAQARRDDERERLWLDWLRSPRRIGWAAAVATVVGGAAIVLLTTRDERLPVSPRSRALDDVQVQEAMPPPESPTRTPSEQVPGTRADADAEQRRQGEEPKDGESGASNAMKTLAKAESDEKASREVAAYQQKSGGPTSNEASDVLSGSKGAAGSDKLIELKRTAAGSDVPVRDERSKAAPSASALAAREPGAKEGEGVRAPKQGQAKPLAERPAASPAPVSAVAPEAATSAQGTAAVGGAQVGTSADLTSQADAARVTGRTAKVAGEVELCGSVFDAQQRPVVGAQIAITPRARTATTDQAGGFCVSAPPGSYTLTVMALGFSTRTMQVLVAGEQADVQVALNAVSVLGGSPLASGTQAVPGFAAPPPGGLAPTGRLNLPAEDVFAAVSDSARTLAHEAQRLSALAAGARTATAFEAAAGAWERTLAVVHGGAAEAEARFRLAEARVNAWQVAPTAGRATAADQAVGSALAHQSGAPERERLTAWRALLKKP